MRRLATAAALALAAVAALVLPSSAAGHSLVRPAGPVVSYLSADATSLNTLQVRASGNRIEFRDETVDGGMDPGSCTPGDVDRSGYIIQTFCPLGGVQRVRIDLGEREDSATVDLPVATTVLGGPGADRIASGAPGDELGGGEGNDALDGGGGDDVLSGDQGADTLTGGAGADRVAARDGEVDTVGCGEGEDTVDADTLDQVAADCEVVTRAFTAAPDAGAEDGRPPRLEVGAPTLQRLGRSRRVRVYAVSSERGAVSASGGLQIGSLVLPVKTIDRERIRVGGGGAILTYRLRGRHWRETRRALRRGRRVVLRLGVVATDRSGRTTRRNAPAIRLTGGGRSSRAAAAVRARAAHPEPGDVDGDEVPDERDNCVFVKNGSQLNSDANLPGGDAHGDACDDDDDADGVPDTHPDGTPWDNCRVTPNPAQTPDARFPEYGAACQPTDDDGDGKAHFDDNCPTVANPDQSDIDGDDRGDVCDSDMDGDRAVNPLDNCPTVWNREQEDRDRDGVGTLCDPDEASVTGPGAGGSRDRLPPRLAARVARRHRLAAVKAGLVVRLRCSEACDATVELVVSRRSARRVGLRRTRILAVGSSRLQGAGTTYVFVRFDKRVRRKLFRLRRLGSRLTVVAVDTAGNRRSLSRRVSLVR